MYLKRVKLRNFKSFAGAAEVPFQPGFTGVAGPNGMGKSNISDAILFVLGPTSSKALRAERLTQLFFNGGASKKAATECEVSLVFDNRDHLLPLEKDEVEITRYVKLAPSDPNGYYSYFYVNGRRSTQGEIDSFLAHARLSGDGYNLVQQGDVNRIVSMGPVPRRGLVERLAGISQFDEELARAESKRSDLETNLDRIGVLLTEIRNHLGGLESQRLQAIQYKQLQDEKRHAEAQLARAGHRLAEQEVRSCESQLKALDGEISGLREDVGRLEAERDGTGAEIDRLEAEIARRGGTEAAKFKAELDERRMAFARLDAAVNQAEDEGTQLADRLRELAETLKGDEKELIRLQRAESIAAERLDAVERDARQKASALSQTTKEAEQSQGKLVGARREVLEAERRREERQKKWEAAVRALEAAKATLASAEREQAQAEDDERTRELELKDAELRTKQARGDAPGRSVSTGDVQKELFQVKNKESGLRAEADRLAQEVNELNRRYLSLDARLKARAEGGSRSNPLAAVDFLLSQRNLGRVEGIRGTVEELASFDPEFQTALTVAAGNRFQALVVETDQVAEECIKLLRAEKRGRATFLPLNKMLAGRPHGKALVVNQSAGCRGFAIDQVHFDEELRPAFWYVFGETLIMEDLARARTQMGGVRLVTVAGDLIEATGAISGGYFDLGGKGAGGDSAAELRRLGEELRTKGNAETAARTELEKVDARLKELTEELTRRSAQAEARNSTGKLLDQELEGARERLKEARRRVAQSADSRAKAEGLLEDADADATKLSEELGEIKQSLQKLQEEYLGHLPGALSGKIRTLQEEAQGAQAQHVTLARELESARAGTGAATKARDDHSSELSTVRKTHEERSKVLKQLRQKLADARSALEAMKSVEAEQLKAVQGQAEQKRRLEEGRLKTVSALSTKTETLRTRVAMRGQQEVGLATARARFAEIEAAIRELPEEAPGDKPASIEELKRTISTVGAQLDAMGSVNLRALEEYDAEKARLEEFQGEVDRLKAEKVELLALVKEIETKKREKLVNVVIAVNDHFKSIYGELSGGGEGEIALEVPSDPLAGGLLIRARPVGKNVQRLEQLSGGEKSLASLAFVFALQRHDPSPLYVFDEVDMSLDGVNAENVGRMLRRNAERAQFIVISLRKVTLKFAHQLFGVTMHGDGCSRVVGLKLDEIVDVDERDRGDARPQIAAAGAT